MTLQPLSDFPWLCRYVVLFTFGVITFWKHNHPSNLMNTNTIINDNKLLGRRRNKKSMKKKDEISFILNEPLQRGTTLHILGERHSGTRWMEKHLGECFNTSVSVTNKLTRWKHWFQYPEDVDFFNQIHVVLLFRNPYDWVDLMRRIPYHSPAHEHLNWTEFVNKPWTMPRFGEDLKFVADMERRVHVSCDQGFTFDQIVPCLEEVRNSSQPKYELHQDGSGRPFDSVVDLRRDKILNFLSIRQYDGVKQVEVWKLEDLITSGTAMLIRQLEESMGVQATCRPVASRTLNRPLLDPAFVEWMQTHIDWDHSEAMIGYEKSDYVLAN